MSLKVSGWKVEKLTDVCEKIQDGSHFSPQKMYSEKKPDRYLYITSKNIRNDYLDLSNISYVDKEFHQPIFQRCNPEYGDVLLTKDGANTGNVTLNTLEEPFSLLSSVCLIKTNKQELLPPFLKYYIQSPDGFKNITGQMTGAAIKRIVLHKIKSAKIPIPPLPEQQRIVSLLDQTFLSIAGAKVNAKRNLVNARELFESVLDGIFENGDDGWEEKKLHEIGDTQTGTTPKTADKENSGDFIPFIKPADIDIFGDGEIRYDNDGLSEIGLQNGRLMPEGSVLMVCIGASIGKVGFVDRDVSCNQQINALTLNKECYPKFFYYALRTQRFYDQVIKNSAQATLPIINKSKWENLSVRFPKSLAE